MARPGRPRTKASAKILPLEDLPEELGLDKGSALVVRGLDNRDHAGKAKPRNPELAKLSKQERIELVFQQFLDGRPIKEICKEFGISKGAVQDYCNEVLDGQMGKITIKGEAQRHLFLDLIRCEILIQSLMSYRDDPRRITRVSEVVIKVMERKSKMLGYDQPTKAITLNVGAELDKMSIPELEAEAQRLGMQLPQKVLALPGEGDTLDVDVPRSIEPSTAFGELRSPSSPGSHVYPNKDVLQSHNSGATHEPVRDRLEQATVPNSGSPSQQHERGCPADLPRPTGDSQQLGSLETNECQESGVFEGLGSS